MECHYVAVRQHVGDVEERARNVAEALGLSPYEARPRVQGPGPTLVAGYADPRAARDAAAALAARGIEPLVLADDEIETDQRRAVARSFELREDALAVTLPQGLSFEVPFAKVELVLRGTRILHEESTKVVTDVKLAVGKSMVVGLPVMKRTKTAKTEAKDSREGFCHVYAPGLAVVALRESALRYDSLGALKEPAATANFLRLVQQIRSRAADARWDDRLSTRSGQVQTLGAVRAPEEFLDVAITLLARVLRR